jgi:hypothetical protein
VGRIQSHLTQDEIWRGRFHIVQRTYNEHAQCAEINLCAIGRHVEIVARGTWNRYASAAGGTASKARCYSLGDSRPCFLAAL